MGGINRQRIQNNNLERHKFMVKNILFVALSTFLLLACEKAVPEEHSNCCITCELKQASKDVHNTQESKKDCSGVHTTNRLAD